MIFPQRSLVVVIVAKTTTKLKGLEAVKSLFENEVQYLLERTQRRSSLDTGSRVVRA